MPLHFCPHDVAFTPAQMSLSRTGEGIEARHVFADGVLAVDGLEAS
jgi:hypothetical protein